ncbi:hypothetical protein BLOT_004708 [Blomia tropicalis]|nr:hypothetical protein BLOT_004708 [Blomia tropicalis]
MMTSQPPVMTPSVYNGTNQQSIEIDHLKRNIFTSTSSIGNHLNKPQDHLNQFDHHQNISKMCANYPINGLGQVSLPKVSNSFRKIGGFNGDDECSSNIYTEPTILEPYSGNSTAMTTGNNSMTVSQEPSSIINGFQREASIQNENINVIMDREKHNQQLLREQTSQSQLTITGQDLEITVNNKGEMIQTVRVHNAKCEEPQIFSPQLLYYYSSQRVELLPLCDLLFNIISLAAYFCDIVFDCVTVYTLFLNEKFQWMFLSLFIILCSIATSQILSYRWYNEQLRQQTIRRQRQQQTNDELQQEHNDLELKLHSPFEIQSPYALALTHLTACGVLWRYFKLFAPVQLTTVKREVRDLCILRMLHGFCQAAPMLLLQVYLVWKKGEDEVTDLNIISILLSLFTLCWALSSFSKNVRQKQIHKLVLTWLGVIFQFFWRLGMITSRIVALTVYAVTFEKWIFVALFLHWFTMFLWLLTQSFNEQDYTDNCNSHNGEIKHARSYERHREAFNERLFQSGLIAWIYIFGFINMQDDNSRYRMTIYYCTMFIENILLVTTSFFFIELVPWYRTIAFGFIFGGYFFGLFFMWLYYRFFHIRHLKHTNEESGVSNLAQTNFTSQSSNNMMTVEKSAQLSRNPFESNQNVQISVRENPKKFLSPFIELICKCFALNDSMESNNIQPCISSQTNVNGNANRNYRNNINNGKIPGVFNCRLNPALKRKKKKPSTVPPPPQSHKLITSNEIEYSNNSHQFGFPLNEQIQSHHQLETIEEITIEDKINMYNKNNHNDHPRGVLPIHQTARPSTNTSIFNRQMNKQPSADTFWRKSALSARSLSISPSLMLKSSSTVGQGFRMSTKHPFSSTITTPTSPVKFISTGNFTDNLSEIGHLNDSNCLPSNALELDSGIDNHKKEIVRPKPIIHNGSINFDLGDPILENYITSNIAPMNDGNEHLMNQFQYNPCTQKNLQSQTSEIILYSQADSSRVYYEYPTSVISHPNQCNQSPIEMEEDAVFARQYQRPPVPGREGDDKSEHDNYNIGYLDAKRTHLNYNNNNNNNNQAQTDQLFEKVEFRENRDTFRSLSQNISNHKIHNNINSTNNKGKHSRHSGELKKKTKKYSKSISRLQKHRANQQNSIRSSSSMSVSSSLPSSSLSSGEDGDIESDINQHDMHGNVSKINVDVSNLYDQVVDDRKEPLPTTSMNQNIMANPRIIRGSAQQASQQQYNQVNHTFHKISNYHLGTRNRPKSHQQTMPISKQKPLYHTAKYKRHNTPL